MELHCERGWEIEVLKDIGSRLKEDRRNFQKLLRMVMNREEISPQEELVEDLMTIISHFAGKLYGMRSHKYERVVEDARKLI